MPVIFWMIRSFRLFILPDLPGNLSESVDALTTVHAVAGLIGMVIGLFVMIRANQLDGKGSKPEPLQEPHAHRLRRVPARDGAGRVGLHRHLRIAAADALQTPGAPRGPDGQLG